MNTKHKVAIIIVGIFAIVALCIAIMFGVKEKRGGEQEQEESFFLETEPEDEVEPDTELGEDVEAGDAEIWIEPSQKPTTNHSTDSNKESGDNSTNVTKDEPPKSEENQNPDGSAENNDAEKGDEFEDELENDSAEKEDEVNNEPEWIKGNY